jgi:hypothetical protein
MSMIQFNLLPDVKLEYIKARRGRALVFMVALIVTAASVALLVVLLGFDGLQKKHLNDLSHDISSESQSLQSQSQLTTILTVQNQLQSLTSLHDKEPAAARLFGYLNQLTPASVDINSFTISFTAHTATITGTADALSSINQYVDTLKATTYSTKGVQGSQPAFSKIVLSSFGLSSSTQATAANQQANYTIALAYDPLIFNTTKTIGSSGSPNTLTVPNQVTTRSAVTQPTDLFTQAPDSTSTSPSSNPTTSTDSSSTSGGSR